jgi:hypothetical protein
MSDMGKKKNSFMLGDKEHDIFKGKGFTGQYVEYKGLPFLDSKNEWNSNEIRMVELPFEVNGTKLQLFMKQQRLEYLFNVKFKKEHLLNEKMVVGFYEYENYKNYYYYGIINLIEFLKEFYEQVQFPLLLETTHGIPEIMAVTENELEKFEEQKRKRNERKKKIEKINKKINEERESNIVYLISSLKGRDGDYFEVERFTPQTVKRVYLKSKESIQNFMNENKRGDSRSNVIIRFYDDDLNRLKWSTFQNT